MTEQQNHTFPSHSAPHAPGMPPRTIPHPPPVRPPGAAPIARPVTGVVAPHGPVPSEDELEPISLIEEPVAPPPAAAVAPLRGPQQPYAHAPVPPPKKIQAFGAESVHTKKRDWKRQTVKTGTGASRVRSFHGKYSEQGLDYLDNAINEWLDANPDIEIKFVTPTVMTFEGKIREPALVLNLWY